MKDLYTYIAVVSFDDDGISIEFPDLPGCYSCADNEEEIPKMAQEAMGLHLWGLESDGEVIPEPSTIRNIELEKGQTCMMVNAYMPPVRTRLENQSVKKTLTIPVWLNAVAEHQNINFSQLLQSAIKQHLNI